MFVLRETTRPSALARATTVVFFYPRDAMLARVLVVALCLSVCLSVCHKSVFDQKGWEDLLFGMELLSTSPTLF